MPNWASATMKVYGERNQLRQFYKNLKMAISPDNPVKVENSWDNMWLGNIFINEGIKQDLWEKYNINPRGQVLSVNDCNDYIEVYYESAWDGRSNDFNTLLLNKYPNLKQVTEVTEPGCEVFYHTDASQRYFGQEVYVDIHFVNAKGEETNLWNEYLTPKDALQDINELYNTKFTNLDEAYQWFDKKIQNNQDQYEYCFVIIKQYDYCEDEPGQYIKEIH